MNAQECYRILLDKVNKLGTNFNQEVAPHTAVRAIREATNFWYDERLKLKEGTLVRQQELQHLLVKSKSLKSISKTDESISFNLPDDFRLISSVNTYIKIGSCDLRIVTYIIENANLNIFLGDEMSRPDYNWEQALAVVMNDCLVVYRDKFSSAVETVTLDYFRKIKNFDLEGYTHLTGESSQDVDLELDDSSCYEVISLAAKIISGNLGDAARFQTNAALVNDYK